MTSDAWLLKAMTAFNTSSEPHTVIFSTNPCKKSSISASETGAPFFALKHHIEKNLIRPS